MNIFLDEETLGELPEMDVDDTGVVTLQFKVIGVSKPGDTRTYELQADVKSIKVMDVSLDDAAERANKEIYVTPRVQPAP